KRRQGIGIFLLKEIEAAAASSGAGVLRAVLPGREDLLGFFEKAGFAYFAGGKEYAVSFGSLRYSSVYRKKVKGKEPFRAKALGGLNTSEREMLTAWCHDQDITDLSDYDEALSAACLSEGRLSALLLCEQMDKGVIVRHMYTDREQPEDLLDCFRVLNRALDLPYDKEEGSPDRADYMLSFGTGHTVEKTLLLHLAGDMVPITEITRETAAVKSLN
ncbi:MAG: hypothetical protein K6G83_03195, partial [Lachnospiraceae bacterium]|nr:hypothetical protein [Lachnospiraceae bacterium]